MKPPRPPIGSIWSFKNIAMREARVLTVLAVNYTQNVPGNYMVVFDTGEEWTISDFNFRLKSEWLKQTGQLQAKMLKLLYGTS